MKAAIIGLGGTALASAEAELLRRHRPAGVILFARNIADPGQLSRLVGDVRELLGDGGRVLVDQEGGRVARLRPPHWSRQPAAGLIGDLHDRDPAAAVRLAWLTGALIGVECRAAGFDVICAPVLDLRWPGATDAIGDRSFGHDAPSVAALGTAMADGLLSAGAEPVGKHAPGHGPATVDSHHELPRIGHHQDVGPDLDVFSRCRHLPWMMTAHLLYEALDAARPASLSPTVIGTVIRGRIGFDGVLISDDLAMGALDGALNGAPGELAAAAVGAGCDIALQCSGRLEDSAAVLAAVPDLTDAARRRLARAAALAECRRDDLDHAALLAEQSAVLGAVVAA